MNIKKQFERGCHGFTLMELMVVMSIIGVLAAMAFPMINAAMDHSKRTICASNLKQLAAALTAYADEHGGRLAGSGGSAKSQADPHDLKAWYNALATYLDCEPFTTLVDKSAIPMPGSGSKSPFVCPACPLPPGVTADRYFGSYAQNVWITGGVGRGMPLLVHQIENPSRFVFFADNCVFTSGSGSRHTYAAIHASQMLGVKGTGSFRHGKYTNICFADGRVQNMIPEQVRYSGMSDSENYGFADWNPNEPSAKDTE